MPGIFISYRREDSAGYAGRLYDRLSSQFGSGSVFMDVATIELGQDFARVIEDQVSSCGVLLALIGKQWLTIAGATGGRRLDNPDDFVRLEIAAALRRGVRVIPVLVQGAGMPSQEALPGDLEPLARRHALAIADAHFHQNVDGLVEAIRDVVQAAGGRQSIGQITVGDDTAQYNLHVGSGRGGVVYNVPPESIARPTPRPPPVQIRPRPFRGMLDRQVEVATATGALESSLPLQLYGEPGSGKTSLLRHLAYGPHTGSFSDGVIYLSARGKAVADILQDLHESFFEVSPVVKPTEAQARRGLQDKNALLLLDDCEATKDELEGLMNSAPACVFVSASGTRTLWGEGRAVALKGLPEEAGVELLERELARPLTPEERDHARTVSRKVDGHPLRLLQLAARVQTESLAEIGREMEAGSTPEAVVAETVSDPQQRRTLSALAAFGGTAVGAQHFAAITGQAEAQTNLDALSRKGLAQRDGTRYSLSPNLVGLLRPGDDVAGWCVKALDYFTKWAEQSAEEPHLIQQEADGILQLLESATGSGNWTGVLRLGRAAEGALALGKRWGAWERVLNWERKAARELNDPAGESHALHQLGSRALCLGMRAAAKEYLGQALAMRESIGDTAGAALSRHNLEQLGPAPPSSREKPREPETAAAARRGLSKFARMAIVALAVATVPAAIFLMTRRSGAGPETPPARPADVVKPPESPTEQPPARTAGQTRPAPEGVRPMEAKTARPPETALPAEPEPGRPPQPLSERPSIPEPVPQPPASREEPPPAKQPPAEVLLNVRPAKLTFSNLQVAGVGETPAVREPGTTGTRRRRVSETEERRVRLTNQGTVAIRIMNVAITGQHPGDFTKTDDSCTSSTLQPDGQCLVSVSFAPKAEGARSAVMMVEHSAPGSPAQVPLSGTGTSSRPE